MKRLAWLCVGLAALVLTASPVPAAEGAAEKRAKPASNALRGEYAMMARECGLTEQQQAKISEIMADVRKKGEAGDRDAMRAAYVEAQKRIADEVLTPEQKEKLEQRRKGMRQRPQERGRERAPRQGDRAGRAGGREPVIVD